MGLASLVLWDLLTALGTYRYQGKAKELVDVKLNSFYCFHENRLRSKLEVTADDNWSHGNLTGARDGEHIKDENDTFRRVSAPCLARQRHWAERKHPENIPATKQHTMAGGWHTVHEVHLQNLKSCLSHPCALARACTAQYPDWCSCINTAGDGGDRISPFNQPHIPHPPREGSARSISLNICARACACGSACSCRQSGTITGVAALGRSSLNRHFKWCERAPDVVRMAQGEILGKLGRGEGMGEVSVKSERKDGGGREMQKWLHDATVYSGAPPAPAPQVSWTVVRGVIQGPAGEKEPELRRSEQTSVSNAGERGYSQQICARRWRAHWSTPSILPGRWLWDKNTHCRESMGITHRKTCIPRRFSKISNV